MKTFTLKFYLKDNTSLDGKCPVYARIIYDRKKCEVSTGLKCLPKEWGETIEKFVASKYYLNKRLTQIQAKIYKVFSTLTESDEPFTIHDIKAGLSEGKKSKITILDFYIKYLEDKTKDGQESANTIAKYNQTFRYLDDWLEQTGSEKLKVSDFDLSMVNEFDHYLKQTPWNNKGDRMKVIVR